MVRINKIPHGQDLQNPYGQYYQNPSLHGLLELLTNLETEHVPPSDLTCHEYRIGLKASWPELPESAKKGVGSVQGHPQGSR
jgi:hypothetical protein